MKSFAAHSIANDRLVSSSGGLFTVISSLFEVVYGVKMDSSNQNAIFVRTEGDIGELRGSKYLQAKPGAIFREVREDLYNNKQVLFVGTICQVNGLLSYLGEKYNNLTTVDIVCEGVPSIKLWRKYTNNKVINSINFRAKDFGWQNYGMRINDTFIPREKNMYMHLYTTNLALRPSCYECVCKQNKNSDITLGDFWGIDEIAPELNDGKGTSLVIIRTAKGEQVFNRIKSKLVYKEVSYREGVKYNPAEYKSFSRPDRRDEFFNDLNQLSFNRIYKKYISGSLWTKIIRRLKRIISL